MKDLLKQSSSYACSRFKVLSLDKSRPKVEGIHIEIDYIYIVSSFLPNKLSKTRLEKGDCYWFEIVIGLIMKLIDFIFFF